MSTDLLAGKRLLITGVITRRSIAFAVAREAQLAGAEVLLTGFGVGTADYQPAATRLPDPPDVFELDVNDEQHLADVASEVDRRWGGLDGVLHAIAYAPEDAIGGSFLETGYESAAEAFRTSAYSLQALARHLMPLLERADSAAIAGLDFDATVAWPAYDWMGVAKRRSSRPPATWPATSGRVGSASTWSGRRCEPRPPAGSRASTCSRAPGRPARRSAGTRRIRPPWPWAGLLPALRLVGGDHRRDPPRGRRLSRDRRGRPCR